VEAAVFGGCRKIETKIEEIFQSQDVEWITAVSMMVDVMYQQFIRERRQGRTTDKTPALEKVMALSGAKSIPQSKARQGRSAKVHFQNP
jgi:hypothetical protein